jgi:hypothetical protein
MRRRHPWLHHARTRAVDLGNTHFIYEAFHAEHRLLVALNLTDAPLTRSIPRAGDIVAGNAACHHTGSFADAGNASASRLGDPVLTSV